MLYCKNLLPTSFKSLLDVSDQAIPMSIWLIQARLVVLTVLWICWASAREKIIEFDLEVSGVYEVSGSKIEMFLALGRNTSLYT